MAIRAELSADLESGAGNGLLRITGLTGSTGPLHFSLRRNQGTTPFLGADGRWQAAETWHEAGEAADGIGEIAVPLGPAVIDPIVEQATTVTYRLTVTIGADSHVTSLRVIRPLFGSGAAAPTGSAALAEQQQREETERRTRAEAEHLRLEQEAAARLRAEEDDRTRVLAEEERRRLAEELQPRPAETEPPVAPGRSRWPLIAVAVALLGAAGGAGAWYGCAIPGFGPARCQGAPPTPAASPAPTALPETCTGLDAAACYQAGQQALQQSKLEPARQLLQQASRLGSAGGSLALARMYDPDTWSAAASPVAKPDWETAVFWYEKAAAQGDATAKATAGKLLCKNATMDLERSQGRTYLEQAANAGSDEAKQLLPTCQ